MYVVVKITQNESALFCKLLRTIYHLLSLERWPLLASMCKPTSTFPLLKELRSFYTLSLMNCRSLHPNRNPKPMTVY